MEQLMYRDLPRGLRHLLTYWQGEEADREIVSEMTEEEEVRMFLEWCQTDYALEDMEKRTLQELRELLKKNPSFLTQNGRAMM